MSINHSHYICIGGCKGVSQSAGVCQDVECADFGQPLDPCDCHDGKHFGAHDEIVIEDDAED